MIKTDEVFTAMHAVKEKTLAPGRTARRIGRAIAAKASDLLPLCDFAGLLLAGYFSLWAHDTFAASAISPPGVTALHRLAWIAAVVAPFILYEARFAALAGAGNIKVLLRSFAGRFLMFLGVICAIAFAGRWFDAAPAGWMTLWLGSAVLLTVTARVLLARYLLHLTRQGALADTVAVVGSGSSADSLIPLLRENAVLFGVFDDRGTRNDPCTHKPETTIQGLIARASAARDERPDRILITLPGTAEPRLLSIVERLRPLGVPVELSLHNVSPRLPAQAIGYVGDWLPVTLLADRPIKRWNAVLKSAEDLVLSAIIIVMLLPVFACIALAIKLDSRGPIFFKQRRHGFNNREFDIYKFRTMHLATGPQDGVLKQTVRDDNRITRVGRFLRRFSLDELPQVFNVLEGNMSLIGPRPHAVNMRTEDRLGQEITDVYLHRHRVKPGITGWAQINGSRGGTHSVEHLRLRIELDLHYVEHWSLLFDLKILFLTFKEVLRGTNAY